MTLTGFSVFTESSLCDSWQTDLKKLQRNPPLVKMPKAEDLLGAHPLLGALPSDIRSPFQTSAKELIKVRGLTLYNEGSTSSGVWLVSNGVVKVRSILPPGILSFALRIYLWTINPFCDLSWNL